MRAMSRFCLLVCFSLIALGDVFAQERFLIRVDRVERNDLSALLDAGLPVVHETESCLYVEGDGDDFATIERQGRNARIVDDAAAISDYFIVGLRPDSDRGAVETLGPVVDQAENWILVRVPRDTPQEILGPARVFVTRLSHEPWHPPAARAERTLREAGAITEVDPLVQKIVDAVDETEIDALWQDLTNNPPTGTRYSTAQGCRDAAAYCLAHYGALGIPAEYQEWNPSHAPNVVATQEGAVHPDRVYIVEGHLDDLPSSGPAPGADDNASGSVTVLEAARVMACWGFKSTIKYLNVTGEEQGLNGSEAYADDAWIRGEDVRGVINMDMNAWEGDGLPGPENLDINYNATSQWLGELFAECATKYGTGLVVDAFYCPSLSASDHYPFWQKGWSAICGITDNEGYCGHGGNYPYYHTSDDTIANCGNPSLFYGAVRTSIATLAELAEPFKITTTSPAYACGSGVDLVLADLDLGVDPGTIESVAVEVWSETEVTPETVVLSERGVDSMFFDGSIAFLDGPPVNGDGLLSVTPGDVVQARYVDALDCDGAFDVPYLATATVDCVEPSISGVEATNVTDGSARIVWTTNEEASSTVVWGETAPPSTVTDGEGTSVDHAVDLTGLQSCTVYWYSVESADVAGNVAVDTSGGTYYHFETYGDFGTGLQPCHAGRVELDAAVYPCGGTAGFEVVDLDLNADPLAAETTYLEITSSTETVPETVLVTETGVNTSRFAGTIVTSAGPPVADGVLQVSDGDVVTVTYRDDDDGTGTAAVSFTTGTVDCAGPGIRNLRITDVTDQRLTVRFETDEPGDALLEWGSTPALGETASISSLSTSHALTVNRLDLCQPFHFRVSSTDATGTTTTADSVGAPFESRSWDIPGLYWRETFESGASDWSLEGEWEVGPPQGLGGSSGNADPTSAYNNLTALGTDLSGLGSRPGDYEHAVTEAAETPTFNATSWSNTKLLVRRQVNVRSDDVAGVLIANKQKRDPVWVSSGTVSEAGWSLSSWDVSALTDGNRTVSVVFELVSDPQSPFFDDGVSSGWNVDDVILKDGSLPDFAACGGCATAPAFLGATAAVDDDPCGATGVLITWDSAISWGTGAAGTYAVYRGTTPVFVPSASNLVASGITATSHLDTTAPTDIPLYYLVRAENDETCGTGPANGGVVDTNDVRVAVTDTIDRPTPIDVESLLAGLVNHAHVRLSWDAVPDASSYRIERSASPAGPFSPIAETGALWWEDLDQGANGNSWYYRVATVGACGP